MILKRQLSTKKLFSLPQSRCWRPGCLSWSSGSSSSSAVSSASSPSSSSSATSTIGGVAREAKVGFLSFFLQYSCLCFVILEAIVWCKVGSPLTKWRKGYLFHEKNFWANIQERWGLDWVRPYRSGVVQRPPSLVPEGRGRPEAEGQCRPQPDPWGARQFRVNAFHFSFEVSD